MIGGALIDWPCCLPRYVDPETVPPGLSMTGFRQGFLLCSPCFLTSRLPMTACGLPDRALSQNAEQVLPMREPRYISTNSRSFVLMHTTGRLHFIRAHSVLTRLGPDSGRAPFISLWAASCEVHSQQRPCHRATISKRVALASSRTFDPARCVRTVRTSRPQPISPAVQSLMSLVFSHAVRLNRLAHSLRILNRMQ